MSEIFDLFKTQSLALVSPPAPPINTTKIKYEHPDATKHSTVSKTHAAVSPSSNMINLHNVLAGLEFNSSFTTNSCVRDKRDLPTKLA